jgi:hypothetical protein
MVRIRMVLQLEERVPQSTGLAGSSSQRRFYKEPSAAEMALLGSYMVAVPYDGSCETCNNCGSGDCNSCCSGSDD